MRVSTSEKTNGGGKDHRDINGTRPAAFQAASAEGSKIFFASSEELTENANTGPDQPEAAIGRAKSDGTGVEAKVIPKRAVGVTVAGEYVYWADPSLNAIGRAKLDGSEPPNDAFIAPGPIGCGEEIEPGVFETIIAPSAPRYVAVDEEHIYWTNTGCIGENEKPLDHGGTIGRATINSGTEAVEDVRPEFIAGAANPQGIAVGPCSEGGECLYWSNAGEEDATRAIGRAKLDGTSPSEPEFIPNAGSPQGLATDGSHLYWYGKRGSAAQPRQRSLSL